MLAFTLRSYWALVLGSVRAGWWRVPQLFHACLSSPLVAVPPGRHLVVLAMEHRDEHCGVPERPPRPAGDRSTTDAAAVGTYTLADEISSMPTTDLLAPLGRVMFPAFVDARERPEEFSRIVLLAFGIQALVGIPTGVGLARRRRTPFRCCSATSGMAQYGWCNGWH